MPTILHGPTQLKTLILLRGLPSTAKSSFITEHQLDAFTLSEDQTTLLRHTAMRTHERGYTPYPTYGKKGVHSSHDLLETRLKKGEFAVLDVTTSSSQDFDFIKNTADKYGYRVMCVNFSTVTVEQALLDNEQHAPFNQLPTHIIHHMNRQIQTVSLPAWIPTVSPENYQEAVSIPPLDFSHYRKIHMIGDIHGCYDALMSFMPVVIPVDELFIFLGDYIDRGIQNAQTLSYLFKHMHHPNFIFLEGNHEAHLWRWANGLPSHNKREFERYTKPDLENGLIDKKTARSFYRKLKQVVHFSYGEKEVLVTHGGLPMIPSDLHLLSSDHFIRGVGDYTVDIDEVFSTNRAPHQYQVHGHRNLYERPLLSTDTSFNVEGKIEKGGELRAVTLDANGFTPVTIPNDVFSERFLTEQTKATVTTVSFANARRTAPFVFDKTISPSFSPFPLPSKTKPISLRDKRVTTIRNLFIHTAKNDHRGPAYDTMYASKRENG